MLLRLCEKFGQTLQIHIQINRRYKCPFFVFRHQDNVGHPWVGGWTNDQYVLPKIQDNIRFISLIELFQFLCPRGQMPLYWDDAFEWVPDDIWISHRALPFQQFLRQFDCYVHEQPPYQLYFRQTTNMDAACQTSWNEHKCALPIHSTLTQNPNVVRHFLRHRRILPKEQCVELFPRRPATQIQPRTT